ARAVRRKRKSVFAPCRDAPWNRDAQFRHPGVFAGRVLQRLCRTVGRCKEFQLDRSQDMTADPRLYQIATLASLLTYGIGWLDFDITVARAVVLLATVLATQAVCDRWTAPGRPVNVRSALISGLSLCLLLRTTRFGLA